MTWQPGTCIKNKYTLVRALGEGGFGITYLATDRRNQQVVIKTINEAAIDPTHLDYFRDDFYNEALRLATVSHHPHIVKIIEIVHHQNLPCIIMEYIGGQNLEDWSNEKKRSESEVLLYIEQIGQALQFVHERNYLHRDVKPQNILIRETGQEAVLIDFGIARSFDRDRTQATMTFVSGGYTPIEQVSPGFGSLGQYTDVYGLAATLYYCLTRTMPPKAEERALRVTHRQDDPLLEPRHLNSTIGESVNRMILKGLEIYPQKRSPTIQAWSALGEEVSAATVVLPPVTKSIGKNPKNWLILSGITAVALVGLLGTFMNRERWFPPTPPDPSLMKSYSRKGLRVDYPNTWMSTDFEANSFDPTIARFTPRSLQDDETAPSVTLGVQKLDDNLSLREIKEQKAQEIADKLAEASQISDRQLELDHRTAYELVYRGKEDDREIQRKQIGFTKDGKLYTLTYEADVTQYTKYEKEAQMMMDSVNLVP